MDINKYIGKFLLKNKYCSLPGLGVFDLKKEGAKHNSSTETISAPQYKITFTPIGSIDDTFASFIATAENVSISNASNNIKEYCKSVKDEIAKTGKYDIEYLGRFSMSNSKIAFHQSDDLDLGVEPAPLAPLVEKLKSAETIENKPDYSYPPANRRSETSILKIILPIALLGLLAAGAYFGYEFYQKSKSAAAEEAVVPLPEPTEVDTMPTSIIPDSLKVTDSLTNLNDTLSQVNPNSPTTSNTTPNAAPVAAGKGYNVAILSYDNEASAISKANKLKNYGNNANVISSNGRFVVVINASHPMNDTTLLVDSLRRFFNPKGPVYIMK
jgi:nucleoid DNA-binding protein